MADPHVLSFQHRQRETRNASRHPRITITKHGVPVAVLQSPVSSRKENPKLGKILGDDMDVELGLIGTGGKRTVPGGPHDGPPGI
ncbi:MAG: type II toxin-antitoxin system prevent-host-death family antitoxin [Proteobacteria bacterium]|nr:type II toxin-antitoxin system prevent-host-death family antitoxin [Pseudomonadota bacterium]